MKKLFRKSTIILLIIQATLVFGQLAFADETDSSGATSDGGNGNSNTPTVATAFSDVEDCIEEFGDDNGKIITIIEEPLDFSKNPSNEDKNEFEVRSCYRNTLVYSAKVASESYTLHLLGKQCSTNAESLVTQGEGDIKIGYSCREVQVYLSKGGKTLLFNLIKTVYFWGGGVAGIIAVTVIVLSGIQISASGGSSNATDEAKKRIIRSLSALALLFLSGLLLNTINPNFFVS